MMPMNAANFQTSQQRRLAIGALVCAAAIVAWIILRRDATVVERLQFREAAPPTELKITNHPTVAQAGVATADAAAEPGQTNSESDGAKHEAAARNIAQTLMASWQTIVPSLGGLPRAEWEAAREDFMRQNSFALDAVRGVYGRVPDFKHPIEVNDAALPFPDERLSPPPPADYTLRLEKINEFNRERSLLAKEADEAARSGLLDFAEKNKERIKAHRTMARTLCQLDYEEEAARALRQISRQPNQSQSQ